MKTTAFLVLGCLLTALVASGQNLSIAKDQARRAAAQTQERSGGGQTAPAQNASAAAQPAPTDPALAATMKNVAGLRTDLTAISAADAVAAVDQRGSLLNHLAAAAQGTKASAANVRKLATDLTDAVAGRKKISAQAQKLGGIIHALFNGGHLSATQQETLLNEATKILTDAEVPAGNAAKVVEDLKAIAAETK